jgi:hypothetical protein
VPIAAGSGRRRRARQTCASRSVTGLAPGDRRPGWCLGPVDAGGQHGPGHTARRLRPDLHRTSLRVSRHGRRAVESFPPGGRCRRGAPPLSHAGQVRGLRLGSARGRRRAGPPVSVGPTDLSPLGHPDVGSSDQSLMSPFAGCCRSSCCRRQCSTVLAASPKPRCSRTGSTRLSRLF